MLRFVTLLALATLVFGQPTTDTMTTLFCTPGRCTSHGTCIESLRFCNCDQGWGGQYCQINLCQIYPKTYPAPASAPSRNMDMEGWCLDVINPVVTAAPDIEIDCSAMNISVPALGSPFVEDNCPISQLTLNYTDTVMRRRGFESCPNAFVIQRTFQATDCGGNTATAVQNIFVNDRTPPVVRARLLPLPPFMQQFPGIGYGTAVSSLASLSGKDIAGLGLTAGFLIDQAKLAGVDPAVLMSALTGNTNTNVLNSMLNAVVGSNNNNNNLNVNNNNVNNGNFHPLSMDMNKGAPTVTGAPLFSVSSNPGVTTTTSSSNTVNPDTIATCNPPDTRAFIVQCNISDACSSFNSLRFAARLRVTHITNRNQYFVSSSVSTGNFDVLSLSHGPLGAPFSGNKMMAPLSVDSQNWVSSDTSNSVSFTTGNIYNNVDNSNQYVNNPVGNTVTYTGVGSNNGNNVNLGMNNYMNNMNNMNMNTMNNMNTNMNMNNMNNNFNTNFNSNNNLFGESFSSSGLPSVDNQCLTSTDYVEVMCGDTIVIQLDREDACLSNDFVSSAPFFETKSMTQDLFGGSGPLNAFIGQNSGSLNSMVGWSPANLGFGANGYVTNTKFNVVAVRGTSVSLQVRAVDECNNRADVWVNAADVCANYVAGRCCPAVTPVARLVAASSPTTATNNLNTNFNTKTNTNVGAPNFFDPMFSNGPLGNKPF